MLTGGSEPVAARHVIVWGYGVVGGFLSFVMIAGYLVRDRISVLGSGRK